MSSQKSNKQYIHVTKVPVGMKLSEAPLPKTIEECIWHGKECDKSGLQNYVGKCPDGKKGCFAYLPKSYTGNVKKSPLDYQI